MNTKELLDIAIKAKENAYVPYSNFRVGAALLGKSGKIYTGCNVECASYGATNCAERTAVFKAVSEGEREFEAIAITSDSNDYTFPCGICRQVIAEFGLDIEVIASNSSGEYTVCSIKDLIPNVFTGKNIENMEEI
ncbi:cytidine deaminase [Peptoclostridium litorale DSM 5388]|uniref:Cytidine deaminase n=1 Tax=Peptoclostridium litorale DSM 5388 TaxID=1121324 RepID=A0A069RLL8_PEPLI|nr:cytidine deaminase [Peptoclostridium litorale]KDR95087.1 cytidine deaminase Cdd [Peptoclostridium litorale DSM 5388]SIN75236.1 cytidine deaminase [Peptoclostridium litorale DSM 5388]